MKITGYGSITSSTVKKRGDVSQASDFADLLAAASAEESSAAAQTGEVAAAGLTNLLALQEISEEEAQRRRLVQQGTELVDVLERLRRQLLMGTMPASLLRDLSRRLSLHRQQTTDPGLNALMDDIELRAAVELAKLETALKNGLPQNS